MTPRWGHAPGRPDTPAPWSRADVASAAQGERAELAERWPHRVARRTARRQRGAQGIVITYAGPADAAAGVSLVVTVGGAPVARLAGARDRSAFVPLDPAARWEVRARTGAFGRPGALDECVVVVRAPGPGRIEWLHFHRRDAALCCEVTTVRPARHGPGS